MKSIDIDRRFILKIHVKIDWLEKNSLVAHSHHGRGGHGNHGRGAHHVRSIVPGGLPRQDDAGKDRCQDDEGTGGAKDDADGTAVGLKDTNTKCKPTRRPQSDSPPSSEERSEDMG
jgi:hypothetical protein